MGFVMWVIGMAIGCVVSGCLYSRMMKRLGRFGKLFVDYKGCPRGAIGRAGGLALEEEALLMPELVDVDGNRWIPVNAEVLHELIEKSYRRSCTFVTFEGRKTVNTALIRRSVMVPVERLLGTRDCMDAGGWAREQIVRSLGAECFRYSRTSIKEAPYGSGKIVRAETLIVVDDEDYAEESAEE